jgi:hypothetical protein
MNSFPHQAVGETDQNATGSVLHSKYAPDQWPCYQFLDVTIKPDAHLIKSDDLHLAGGSKSTLRFNAAQHLRPLLAIRASGCPVPGLSTIEEFVGSDILQGLLIDNGGIRIQLALLCVTIARFLSGSPGKPWRTIL